MQIWNMKMKMGYNKSDIRGSAEPFCEGAPSHSRQLYGRTSIIFLTDFIASAQRPECPPFPSVRFLITERRLISMVRKVTWYAFEIFSMFFVPHFYDWKWITGIRETKFATFFSLIFFSPSFFLCCSAFVFSYRREEFIYKLPHSRRFFVRPFATRQNSRDACKKYIFLAEFPFRSVYFL